MPSRRTHSKSRHGCVGCKARKVKCDEGRPACASCTRRNEACVYSGLILQAPSPSPRQLATESPKFITQAPSLSVRFLREFDPAASVSPLLHGATSAPAQTDVFPGADLELMHHYTTATCRSVAPAEAFGEVMQLFAPREAFRKAYLMHGILAVSALHLAHLRPAEGRHFTELAMRHHASAVAHFRPVLSDVNAENAAAIFLLSNLLVCISLALAQGEDVGPSVVLGKSIDLFHLQRGMSEVIGHGWEWFPDGPLRWMFNFPLNDADAPLPFADAAAVNALEEHIMPGDLLRPAYVEAIRCLRACWPLETRMQDRQSLVLAWPVRVDGGFFAAVVDRRPMALAILAYWGLGLHALKGSWWVGEGGKRLVLAICDILGPDWEPLLRTARTRVEGRVEGAVPGMDLRSIMN